MDAPAALVAPAPTPVPARATTLEIPALGLTGGLVALDVDGAGVLQPPATADVAGWFVGSAVPGDRGPTVIAGHVDSREGPGVFFRLRSLPVGAHVEVGRSDGRRVDYEVVSVVVTDKNSFPTDAVYGPTPGPELRLITCGGQFDRRGRRYLDNVVVSAVVVGT